MRFAAEIIYVEDKQRALQIQRPSINHWKLAPAGNNCSIGVNPKESAETE